MRKRFLLMLIAFLIPLAAHAQWRVGVTGGAAYNVFSMDTQYLTDYRLEGRWGATAGVMGQYDVNGWLAVRAELNWTQKNYRKYRVILSKMDYQFRNNYLQLPVMASFSVGGKKLRGLCNLGVYGGYWLGSYLKGTDYNVLSQQTVAFSEKQAFNAERDQRWDFGFVGGLGLEYRIAPHWAAQAGVRCYYSTVSTTRQYMRVKDYRYHTTLAAEVGVFYLF